MHNQDNNHVYQGEPKGAANRIGELSAAELSYDGTVEEPDLFEDNRQAPFLWRLSKWFIISALLLTFVGSAALLFLYHNLEYKPLHIRSLIPYIERAVNSQLNDVHIKIKSVILRREDKQIGVQIRLLGMQILQADGKLVAEAPEAGFQFDVQALMRGESAVEEIIFYEPQLAVLYDEETGLKLSFGQKKNVVSGQDGKALAEADLRGGIAEGNAFINDQAVVKKLASIFTNLHKYRKSTASLKKLRITDAQLYFSQGGINSAWTIPSFTVDLTQDSQQSDINGSFSVLTDREPMTVDFKVKQKEEEDSLEFNVINFMPSYFFPKIGYSGTVGLLHVPVSALTTIRLAKSGTLNSIKAIIKLEAGQVFFPGNELEALKVLDSTLRLSYLNGDDERITIEPSVLRWDGNEASISGTFLPAVREDGWEKGRFLLLAENIRLNSQLFHLPPQNVGQWLAKGTFNLKQHYIHLANFLYKFGDAEIRMTGDVFRTNKVPDIKIHGEVSEIPLGLLKRIWNNKVAPETLQWIGDNLLTGTLRRGTFKVDIPHTAYDYLNKHKMMPEKSLDLKLVTSDILGSYMKDLPPIFTSEAHMHITGQYFSLYAKNVVTHLASSERIKVSNFRFQVDQAQLDSDIQYGLYEFDIAARNSALIEYLGLPALGILNKEKYKANAFKGNANGHLKFKIPFKEELQAEDIAVKGHLDLKGLARKKIFGNLDLTKGNVRLSLSPQAIEAKGKILINRVPADLTWQHIFKATPKLQPPLRITTTLTKKRQKRLGIDTGRILTGFFPVELTVERMDLKKPIVRVHADITNAQFNLPSLFWTKLPGIPAQVQFEVVQGRHNLHLKDVSIFGEDLGIEGDIYLDRKNRLQSFKFSQFTLNLLTSLKVSGKMRRSDNVLEVKAEGRSFDGRPFFRTLFSQTKANKLAMAKNRKQKGTKQSRKKKRKRKKDKKKYGFYGVNIHAKIKTLIGYHEETASNVFINMKKRGSRLLSLISRGTLRNNASVAVNLVVGAKNQRYLVSETTNTGAALKLIGFYSKMLGGQGSLQVNLDADGQADQVGTLWLKNFAITGDDVVLEVLTNRPNRIVTEVERKRNKKIQLAKTSLNFDKLKARFSIGNGQMLLHESYVNGPLLGATLRGKVDFRAKRIALGGTYVPLFGLNSSLKAIPILGDIVVGRNGEGIFGITYAIQGNMKDPTVLVNPLSLITPGIFRQIMEFQDPNMQTLSRRQSKKSKKTKKKRKRRSRKKVRHSQN